MNILAGSGISKKKAAEKSVIAFSSFPLFPCRVWPCQIDFLFSVTCAHAKKLSTLNLFIQKLACRSFLFIIGEYTYIYMHIYI